MGMEIALWIVDYIVWLYSLAIFWDFDTGEETASGERGKLI
jgi:hypothetical protein